MNRFWRQTQARSLSGEDMGARRYGSVFMKETSQGGDPLIGIWLVPRQQKLLIEAIGQMTFHTIQDLVEHLNIASSALEKLAMGHAFTAGEEGEKWMRGVAESALEDIES